MSAADPELQADGAALVVIVIEMKQDWRVIYPEETRQ